MKENQHSRGFEGSINWHSNNKNILKFVAERAQKENKAISFIFGFKMEITNCSEYPTNEEFLPFEAGTIIQAHNDGFLVRTGDGVIIVNEYVIYTPYVKFDRLGEFLEKAHLELHPKLTNSAFTTNEDANNWEKLYQKFTINSTELEQYEKELEFQTVSLEGQTSKNLSKVDQNEYGANLRVVNEIFLQYLIKKIGLKKGDRVLDLGCATGWATRIFAEQGLEAHGADISPLSIKQAKISVPNANFFVLDIFDLLKHENLKGKFDLVFCRDLGIAQKIVDWNDEKWQNVSKGLMELLSDRGVVFWIQMSDLSGQIYETGWSNPTITTLLDFFEKYGHVLDLDVFSYQCFLITKKNPKSDLISHISEFNKKYHNNIYSWWKNEKSEESKEELSKVLYSKISKLLALDQEILNRGAIIFGKNQIAHAYYHLLHEKGIFRSFCLDEKKSSDYLGQKVLPLHEIMKLKPSILVLTESEQHHIIKEKNLESCFELIVNAFDFDENYTHDKIFLLSADQDEVIGNALLPPLMKILH